MQVVALWCCACGTLKYVSPGVRIAAQLHRPQRHTCESQYRDHVWLRVGLVDVRDVPDVDSVDVLRGAGGGSPPVEARSAGSERPDVARHPHPLVTTATLPRGSHPLPPQPSAARGEGTPSKPRCTHCFGDGKVLYPTRGYQDDCPFCGGSGEAP